jgi:hypothetical protein
LLPCVQHASVSLFWCSRNHSLRAYAQIKITPLTTKKLEHMGIKVQLLGQIEVASERGVKHEFMGMGKSCIYSSSLMICYVFCIYVRRGMSLESKAWGMTIQLGLNFLL